MYCHMSGMSTTMACKTFSKFEIQFCKEQREHIRNKIGFQLYLWPNYALVTYTGLTLAMNNVCQWWQTYHIPCHFDDMPALYSLWKLDGKTLLLRNLRHLKIMRAYLHYFLGLRTHPPPRVVSLVGLPEGLERWVWKRGKDHQRDCFSSGWAGWM